MPTTVQINDGADKVLEFYIFDQKTQGKDISKNAVISELIKKHLTPQIPPDLRKRLEEKAK